MRPQRESTLRFTLPPSVLEEQTGHVTQDRRHRADHNSVKPAGARADRILSPGSETNADRRASSITNPEGDHHEPKQ
jgi:hypothetical protein